MVMVGAIGAIGLGCALRTLLPYVMAGLAAIAEAQDWTAWPRFKPSYLSAFGLAVIAYAIGLLTVPGAWGRLLAMEWVQIVALAYAGQDLARQVVKVVAGAVGRGRE